MNNIIEDLKAALKIALLLVSYIAIATLGVLVGKEIGRKEYHMELLKELDAKDGVPVLLYPPDKGLK